MPSRSRRDSEVAAILEGLGKGSAAEERELSRFVEKAALRLERNAFLELLHHDIYKRIREHLMNGASLIAVRAIDQLICVDFLQEEPSKLMELVTILMAALDQVGNLESAVRERVLEIAVHSFGRLVKSGGAVAAATAGTHIEAMLKSLNEADTLSTSVAFRLLTVLAQNAPARFNLYAEQFVMKAYPFLFHSEASVRRDALEALTGCMGVVAQRASGRKQGWFQDLAQKLMNAISTGTPGEAMKALVALRVVMQHSADNLLPMFPALNEMMLSLLPHQESAIKDEVIHSIPTLAQMCPLTFVTVLPLYMDHFIALLRNRTHEETVLASLERLIHLLHCLEKTAAAARLQDFSAVLKEILSSSQTTHPVRHAAIQCIGACAHSLHESWRSHALTLLPLLLESPVHQIVLDAAHSVVEAFPEALPTVRETFLQYVLQTLSSHPERLHMSFKILSMFNFDLTPSLCEKLNSILGPTLCKETDVTLRSNAAHAALNLLSYNSGSVTDDEVSEFMDDLCSQLITTAVMDTSSSLRFDIFSEMLLHEELHERLAQDITIRRFAYSLYDTSLPIRQMSIQLLGRLSMHNFAAVLPLLHELLLKFMENLKFTGDIAITAAVLTDTSLLLKSLVLEQPKVTEQHLPWIFESLLHRLETYTSQPTVCLTVKDPTSEAICGLLMCLIEVIGTMPLAILKRHISRISVVLTEIVADMKNRRDRKKQLAAVKTVAQICRVAGEVLLRHMNTTELISCLTHLKQKSAPRQDIQAVNQIIQDLSAWDSAYLALMHDPDATPEVTDLKHAGDMSFPTDESMVGDEEFYSSAAINASLAVLEDTRNTDYVNIIQCLMMIFGRLQRSGVVYLQRVVPALTKVVRQGDHKLRLVLFQHLGDLVTTAGRDVVPYCDGLVNLCLQFWTGSSSDLTVHILNLMAELARAVKVSFVKYLPDLIPHLDEILSNPADFELVEPVLSLLQACDSQLGAFLPVLFPMLMRFLQEVPIFEDAIPLNVQREVLKTVRHVLLSVEFREAEKYLMASKLFLTLIGLLRQEDSLRADTIDTLVIAVSVLGPKISRAFSAQIQTALGTTEESLLQEALQRLNDPNFGQADVFAPDELQNVRATTFQSVKKVIARPDAFTLKTAELAHVLDTRDRSTREDWEEWFRSLSLELLVQSSSPAFRACHSLAQKNPAVAKWLFKYSLLSVWAVLDDSLRVRLLDALETVLSTPAVPLEVIQPVISLGEYLSFIEEQEVEVVPELTSLDELAAKCSLQTSNIPHYRLS